MAHHYDRNKSRFKLSYLNIGTFMVVKHSYLHALFISSKLCSILRRAMRAGTTWRTGNPVNVSSFPMTNN
jgi:hypothetical protein